MNMGSRVAFLSDAHGNSPALEAVLQDIDQYNVSELVVLGDIFMGVDPHGCMALLQKWAEGHEVMVSGVRGNAESYLLTPNREQLGDYGIDWVEPVANLMAWCEERLTPEDLEWIQSWPLALRWRSAFLVHDSPFDRIKVVTESNPIIRPEHREWFYHGQGIAHDLTEEERTPFFAFMEKDEYDYLFCGHSHIPFIYERQGKIICSGGSVGASLNGDWRASWVLLETGLRGVDSLSIHHVEYDLTKIYQLVDENPDYPSFLERPGTVQAFKKWYSTGYHWAFFVPGMLPDVPPGFDVADIE